MKGKGFFFFNHEELFSMQLGIVISHYHNISKCSNFYYHKFFDFLNSYWESLITS